MEAKQALTGVCLYQLDPVLRLGPARSPVLMSFWLAPRRVQARPAEDLLQCGCWELAAMCAQHGDSGIAALCLPAAVSPMKLYAASSTMPLHSPCMRHQHCVPAAVWLRGICCHVLLTAFSPALQSCQPHCRACPIHQLLCGVAAARPRGTC